MRLHLALLSFVLCGAIASDAPAQGAPRGARFGGGRGISAPRGAAPSTRSFGGGTFGSRGASSMSRASGGLNWRSNPSAGSVRSAASGASRGASGFSGRSTPRYSSGQVASGNRFMGGPRFNSGSARGTGRSAPAAGASSTGTLSPFARNLSRSSSGSRVGRDGTATRGTGATSGRFGDAQSRGRGTARSPGADQVPGSTVDRRTGQTGFRPSTGARRGGAADGTRGHVSDSGYRRYGYYPRPYSHYDYGYHHHGYYCSPYYLNGGFYLGFTFGAGAYFGLSYYYPWYHCGSSYAFFYGAPLSYCYVPYGFYFDATPVYVTRYVYVQDTYPATDYESVEAAPPPAEPAEGQKVVEPEPAAGSPVAEKYLRDASDAFRKAEYLEAAKLFRLAALSTPDNAAPLFALGQSLIAIGSDAYAAKVIRKAVVMNPGLVKEPGDIVGVFKDQAEFDRVMADLLKRAEESPAGSDARFLAAAERYFSGDPKAAEGFTELRAQLPDDKAVELFAAAAEKRFAAAEELPPVAPAPK